MEGLIYTAGTDATNQGYTWLNNGTTITPVLLGTGEQQTTAKAIDVRGGKVYTGGTFIDGNNKACFWVDNLRVPLGVDGQNSEVMSIFVVAL